MRRRDLIKGSIVVAATSLIAMPVIAEAVELDEVAIIRKLVSQSKTLEKIWYGIEDENSEKAVRAWDTFSDACSDISDYPVKTIKGLNEKIKFVWDDNDLQYMAGKVAKDINRLVALT